MNDDPRKATKADEDREHRADPIEDEHGVMVCRICGKPTESWRDGWFPTHTAEKERTMTGSIYDVSEADEIGWPLHYVNNHPDHYAGGKPATCMFCGRPESDHDRRHNEPGSPAYCLS